jgi:hypothetical protein
MTKHGRHLILLTFLLSTLLACSYSFAAEPLQSGVPINLSLAPLTYVNYYIDVPANATRLTATITNGNGDLDLFMKYGSPLSGATYGEVYESADAVSDGPGADERIELTAATIPALQGGRWHIAPANVQFGLASVSFTLTATIETAAPPQLHQLSQVATPPAATPWLLRGA